MRITNLNGQNIPYHFKGLYRLECWNKGGIAELQEYYTTRDSAVNAGKAETKNYERVRVMVGEEVKLNLK